MIAFLEESESFWESIRTTLALFHDSFYATLGLALILSFLGVHVVLRRVVFVGVALSELASLGIAGAFFAERFPATAPNTAFGFLREHSLMGALSNLLGLAFLVPSERRYLSRESRIAICFAAAGAVAVLLVAGSPHGMDEIKILMTGDPLFVSHQDVNTMFAILIPVLATLLIFFRRFLLVAFDREMALSLGLNVRVWDVVFYVLLGVSVAMAIHLAGMLFAVGFLVLPGAAALAIARHPWSIFGVASGVGLLSATAGFVLSHEWDLPLGPTVIAAAFVLYAALQAWLRAAAALRRV